MCCHNKTIQLNPNDDIAWYNLGVAYERLGEAEKAVQSYQKIVEITPHDENAWLFLGWAYGRMGYFRQEVECYETVLMLNPNHQRAKRDLEMAQKRTPLIY